MALTLPLNYRILRLKALEVVGKKWKLRNACQRRLHLDVHGSDQHQDKPSMAMEPRFRNYSSDSVGSDRVFLEESNYQGMLRVMDYRKGRVCRRYFSVSLAADCRCLFFLFLLHFISSLKCRINEKLHLFLHVIFYFWRR